MIRRFAVLLAALTIASCSLNLGHIILLRDDQDRFSRLADKENKLLLVSTFPGSPGEPRTTRNELIAPAVDDLTIRELQRGYQEVFNSLTALTRQAGSELQEDRLLGSALTLRVLAQWRAVFYAHLLREQENDTPSGTVPPSLSAVATQAANVLQTVDSQKIELFPRDRFLLRAMKAMVRYDIAYIRTLGDSKEKNLDPTPAGKKIVQERIADILKADQELVEATGNEPLQIRRYAFVARLTMLRSATILAALAVLDKNALPELATRINELHTQYGKDKALPPLVGVKPEHLRAFLDLN